MKGAKRISALASIKPTALHLPQEEEHGQEHSKPDVCKCLVHRSIADDLLVWMLNQHAVLWVTWYLPLSTL